MMIPPIVGVPALAWWPSGPSSRMCWPNSRSCSAAMNRGERNMQISSAAVPAMRTSPISRGARLTACSPTPRDALTSTVSPGRTSLSTSGDGLLGVGDRAVAGHVRRQRPDGDHDVGAPARVRADLLVVGDLVGAELEHVAEHGDAPARRTGELVEGGAHRHRVGVVAVVHDGDPVRAARAAAPAARTARPRRARAGWTPSARAAASARHRVAAQVRGVEGQLDALEVALVEIAAGPEVAPRSRPPAGAARAAARPPARPPSRRARRPASSSALAAATASTVPISSRCTGPTDDDHARRRARRSRASSAIWPTPRIPISSTSTSVSAGAERIGERQADLGVEVLRRWPPSAGGGAASRAGCPWSTSCRSSP